MQDLYAEKIDPQTGRYLFRGQVEQARSESEWIRMKAARARGIPPVGDAPWPGGVLGERPLFCAALGRGRARGIRLSVSRLDRAGNWGEFTAALARYPGPGQNFVYADVDGNIGYRAAGRLPIRKNYDGDLPADGKLGRFRMGGLHSVRSVAGVLQSTARLDRDGESKPVPGELSVSRERGIRACPIARSRFGIG